jgi:hypothetical protein
MSREMRNLNVRQHPPWRDECRHGDYLERDELEIVGSWPPQRPFGWLLVDSL